MTNGPSGGSKDLPFVRAKGKEGGLVMKRAGRGKLTGLWLTITAIGLSMALAIPSVDAAGRKDRGLYGQFR